MKKIKFIIETIKDFIAILNGKLQIREKSYDIEDDTKLNPF